MGDEHDDNEYWYFTKPPKFSFDEDDKNLDAVSRRDKFTDDNVSEISYDLLDKTEFQLDRIISSEKLLIVLEEQSMKETPLPKTIAIEDELKILRQKARETYHAPPPPSSIIERMLIKKPYSLECFRALHEKESLLDAAIKSGNGDAILAIVLFLLQTLKRKYFNLIIQTRPDAFKHYINYLQLRYQISECSDLLTMLGKSNETVMLQFDAIMKLSRSPDVKKQKLNKIYNEYFTHQSNTVHSYYTNTVINYISLLEWQLTEKIHNAKFKIILDSPVVECLYNVCSNYKWGNYTSSSSSDQSSSMNGPSNPYKFAETYKISQSQFDWIALNERGQCQAWLDVQSIFEKKSWHTLKTTKTFSIGVPLERVLLQLNALHAPDDVLNYFLPHIDDPHRRLALAKRFNAGKSIVDALCELKDRVELERYCESLDEKTRERFYAENALKNLKSKWKADNIKLLKN